MRNPRLQLVLPEKIQIRSRHVLQRFHALFIRHHSMEIPRVVVSQPIVSAELVAHGLVKVFLLVLAIQLQVLHARQHGRWDADGRASDDDDEGGGRQKQ